MYKRISWTFALIALAACLSLAALAQGTGNADKGSSPQVTTDKNLIGTQVKLGCSVGGPVEFPTVTITNNTSSSIAAGKKLFWQVNSSMKGAHLLQQTLAPGKSVNFSTEARGAGGVPTAWYFK